MYDKLDQEKIIDKFEQYIKHKPRPFVSDFCSMDDVFIPRQTLYNWSKSNRRLKFLIDMCKTKQRSDLCRGGLDNDYNPQITRLILSTNHGFTERVENVGDPERPEQKMITLNMSPADAARAYSELVKSEEE